MIRPGHVGVTKPVYVETCRATVAPAYCDHLGHMNVQHYFAMVSDGMFAVMGRVGLDAEEIRRRQVSFAVEATTIPDDIRNAAAKLLSLEA